MVMIPEMMARAKCCKKLLWINKNRWKCIFRLMDFPEFVINHELRWEFQLIISEILGHHKQGWPRNLHFKFLLSIYLLKRMIMLWRFYMNITSCIDLIGYWSETIFIISLKENIVFVKFFGTSFGRNIIASFTEF